MNRVKKLLVSFVRNLFKDDDGTQIAATTSKKASVESVVGETPPKKEEEVTVPDDSDDRELDRLEKLLRDTLFNDKEEKPPPPVAYILNSGEDQWFYNPNTRSMVRVPGGTQLIVQDPTPDDGGKILCYSEFGFVMVPEEEISLLGMN